MAQIIDILSGEYFSEPYGGNTGTIDEANYFLTDNTQTDKEIVLDLSKWLFVFTQNNTERKKWFIPNDHIRILSIAVSLPYHFTLGDSSYNAGIKFWYTGEGSAVWYPVAQFGNSESTGVIPLLAFNYELSTDIFVPHGAINNKAFGCYIQGKISMIGCPASLNNTKIYPTAIIKVLHNLPMVEDTAP